MLTQQKFMRAPIIILVVASLYTTLIRFAVGGGLVTDDLIGWKGETYVHDDVFGRRGVENLDNASARWIETVSWSPRAFVFHNFLTKEECDHIIHTAAPQLKRSTVVGAKDSGVVDNIRTSYGMFINRNHDEIIATVQQKLANWTHLPQVNQEDLQVCHCPLLHDGLWYEPL